MAMIDMFFQKMLRLGASDLHLAVGAPPTLRINGEMAPLDIPAISVEQSKALLFELLSDEHKARFIKHGDLDFAYELDGIARFRCNYFKDRRGPGGVFRLIPPKVPTLKELALPKSIYDLCGLNSGLVIVAGPTGSGKSTTLAAMINHINHSRRDHVITIEDPIEFVHQNRLCMVNQREVETHTDSFSIALRAALREDPDVILVGEMRDLATMELALTAAETGHLVLTTLHTQSAHKSIERVINAFPSSQQNQVRQLLSETLSGVISQLLLKRADRPGRAVAMEIMLVNSAISNLIREGKGHQIQSAIQTSGKAGMQTRDAALLELVRTGKITQEMALTYATDKNTIMGGNRTQARRY